MLKEARNMLQYTPKNEFFKHKEQAVIDAPHKEGPICTVPEPRQEPNNQQIADRLTDTLAAAAKGDIDVIAEPRTERNMPATPKFRDASGKVRIIKVLRKLIAEHFCHADSHIGITAEVKIEHQAVAQAADPRAAGGQRCRADPAQRIKRRAEHVGKQHLFPESHNEQPCALADLLPLQTASGKLLLHIRILNNRA